MPLERLIERLTKRRDYKRRVDEFNQRLELVLDRMDDAEHKLHHHRPGDPPNAESMAEVHELRDAALNAGRMASDFEWRFALEEQGLSRRTIVMIMEKKDIYSLRTRESIRRVQDEAHAKHQADANQ